MLWGSYRSSLLNSPFFETNFDTFQISNNPLININFFWRGAYFSTFSYKHDSCEQMLLVSEIKESQLLVVPKPTWIQYKGKT